MKCLSIHVTDLCNSKCSFCVVGSPLYLQDTIRYDDMKVFLEANAGQGFEAVNLHGGEATIYPRLLELLELICSLGYPEVHLQTNAIKLSDEVFAKSLAAFNVTKFIISLHGNSAELHDSQTGSKGGYDRTLKGIRNAKALGAHVRTNTVITVKNLPHLIDICRVACDLGVDHINLSNMHPVGSALYSRSNAMPSFASMQDSVYRSVDLCMSYDRAITLEGFPYCIVKDRIQHQLNEGKRVVKMLMRGHVIEDYDQFMSDSMRIYGAPCKKCAARSMCGGVYPQYIDYFGWKEIATIHQMPGATEKIPDLIGA